MRSSEEIFSNGERALTSFMGAPTSTYEKLTYCVMCMCGGRESFLSSEATQGCQALVHNTREDQIILSKILTNQKNYK